MERTTLLVLATALVALLLSIQPAAADWKDWEFRLVAGGEDSGIVQMRPNSNEEWGYVCADYFGQYETIATCRALGLPPQSVYDDIYSYKSMVPQAGPFYLANISCHSSAMQLPECQSNFYANGTIPEFVCPSGNTVAAAVQCPMPATEPPSPPVIFHFTFIPTEHFTQQKFLFTFKNNILQEFDDDAQVPSITEDRIVVSELVETDPPGDAAQQFVVTFYFTDDPDPNQPRKEEFEYYIEKKATTIFGTALGFKSSTSVPPPTTLPPPPPDTTGWEFRLRGGPEPYIGLLEVRTSNTSEWGVVCDDGFRAPEGIAACLSAGWYTTSVDIIEGWGGPPGAEVLMDDVKCNPGDGKPITECQFKTTSNCGVYEGVGINCYFNTTAPPLPPNTTFSPKHYSNYIEWTAKVLKSAYKQESYLSTFMPNIAKYIDCPLDRLNVTNNTIGEKYYYTTFVVVPGMPWDPPRLDYDIKLEEADAFMLDIMFSVKELSANDTATQWTEAPAAPHADGWTVTLTDLANKRGRVKVRPAAYTTGDGSVCSTGLGMDAAKALCNAAGVKDFDFSGIVPDMGGGDGTIFLSDIKCTREQTHLNDCSSVVSYPDKKKNNCSHYNDAGVICGSKVGPEPADANVVVFTAKYLNGKYNYDTLFNKINAVLAVMPGRLVVTSVDVLTDMVHTNVIFNFANHQKWQEVPRTAYEYILQDISPSGVKAYLGMEGLTWTTGPQPTTAPPEPPTATHDQTGWEFRIRGGGSTGVLEVNTGSQWGLVCGDGATLAIARAACTTLGYTELTNVFQYIDSEASPNGLPMSVSNVTCPTAAGTTFAACSFLVATDSTPMTCTPGHQLSVDCTPPPPPPPPPTSPPPSDAPVETASPTPAPLIVYDAIGFTAIVKSSTYSATNFIKQWSEFYVIGAHRVQIDNISTFKSFTYVTFGFVNDANTNAVHPPSLNTAAEILLSRLMHAQSVAQESSESGGVVLTNADRDIVQAVTKKLDAPTLFSTFGIYEMRFNDTTPDGAIDADFDTWEFRLVSDNTSYANKMGRLELQAGSTAPWGTVCETGFAAAAATAMCNAARPPSSELVLTALAIPHYKEGRGIIYLDNVKCNTTTPESCEYSFSTKTQKENQCTHMDDIGLMCGNNVGPMTPMPTVFRGVFPRSTYSPELFVGGMVRVFGGDIFSARLETAMSDDTTNYYVNFTFKDPITDGPLEFTRGDFELVMKSISPDGLKKLFSMSALEYYVPAAPPATPPTTTDIPPTTAVVTEPVTTAVVTEPATTAVVTEPATTAVVTEPATTAVVTEPATTAVVTEPATTAVVTEPATTAVVTEPATTSVAATSDAPATDATTLHPTTGVTPPPTTNVPSPTTDTTTPLTTIPSATTGEVTTAVNTTAPASTSDTVTTDVTVPLTTTGATSGSPVTPDATTIPVTHVSTSVASTTTVAPTPSTTAAPHVTSTPAPTTHIEPSVNGVFFTVSTNVTFETLRGFLRMALCRSPRCPGYYGQSRDIYSLLNSTEVAKKRTFFAVSFNTSSLMYEALGLPQKILTAFFALDTGIAGASILSVEPVEELPLLANRGEHLLSITTLYSGCSVCSYRSQYRSFSKVRSNIMWFLYSNSDHTTEMTLVNATGYYAAEGTFNMTYVVSFQTRDQLIEVSSVEWWNLRKEQYQSTYVTDTKLLAGESIDVSTLLNRVEFVMMYTGHKKDYMQFTAFAEELAASYGASEKGGSISSSQIHLVDAETFAYTNGSLYQRFVVSLPPKTNRDVVIESQLASLKKSNPNLNVVEAVLVGAASTDAPSPPSPTGSSKSPTAIPFYYFVAGAVGLVVFLILIILTIRCCMMKGKRKGGDDGMDDGMMEELNTKPTDAV